MVAKGNPVPPGRHDHGHDRIAGEHDFLDADAVDRDDVDTAPLRDAEEARPGAGDGCDLVSWQLGPR